MGIDKSMHEDSPIVVIDGTVYQYGKLPDEIMWTNKKRERDTWSVEHHSYAKDYHIFYSEADMMDFIDGLPESNQVPFEPNFAPFEGPRDEWGNLNVIDHEGFDREFQRYWKQVCEWRHDLAEGKRREREQQPKLAPEERFATEARAAIDAVLNAHLTKPWERYNDPKIARQVQLILDHHLREYRRAVPEKEPQGRARKKKRT